MSFKLGDLTQDFFDKVVFLVQFHSSGLGGPGAVIIITENDRHYIDIEMLFEEIKLLGEDSFVQKIGRPLYKVRDWVMFYPNHDDEYLDGKVVLVDAYGTIGQHKEASYDIELVDGTWYKHIPESQIERIGKDK